MRQSLPPRICATMTFLPGTRFTRFTRGVLHRGMASCRHVSPLCCRRSWRWVSFGLIAGQTVVGRCNLAGVVRGPFQSGVLSYWVDSKYAGRGLASAAVRVVVERAREELGLHRIEATTLLHNVGSQRVLLKAGFHQIGMAPRNLPTIRNGNLIRRALVLGSDGCSFPASFSALGRNHRLLHSSIRCHFRVFGKAQSSGRKMSSIAWLNVRAMLNASGRLGSYLPLSIAMMVCRVTFTLSASSAWVRLCSARSTRSRFCISGTVDSRRPSRWPSRSCRLRTPITRKAPAHRSYPVGHSWLPAQTRPRIRWPVIQ